MGSQHSSFGRSQSLDVTSTSQRDYDEPSASTSVDNVNTDAEGVPTRNINRVQRVQRSKSTLVVVNRKIPPITFKLEDDPLFKKLSELPAFLPLMYEAENSSNIWGTKNKVMEEIRNKIDSISFIQISRLYQDKLRGHAESINLEQFRLSKCIREVDYDTSKLFKTLYDRDKKFSKSVNRLKKLNDVTHSLSKCQMVLYECKQQIQILNDMLPLDDRLETFVWMENDSNL